MEETAVPAVAVEAGAPAVVVPPPVAPAPTRAYEWAWWIAGGIALAAVLAAVVAWIVHERSKRRAAGALLPVRPTTGTGPLYPVTPVTPSPPPPPPNGGPFYPVGPPSSAVTFTRAANTNTVSTVLADLGLSQNFADPAVGTFSGTAASVDACEARCRADARCVQYVYDASAVPPNPLWDRNGCWLRFVPPTAGQTTAVANFITGTRA